MKNLFFKYFLFFQIILSVSCSDKKANDLNSENGNSIINAGGNSIQLDPLVFYSSGISIDQLIKDLKKANIGAVHFMFVNTWDGTRNDSMLKPELIKALKDNNISMWLMVLGNCFYSKPNFPISWEMGLLTPYSGVYFYTFHHPDFVAWQVNRVRNFINNYPDLVGIEFAESYFPEWKTLQNNGFYGDVSPFALNKFSKDYLNESNVYSFNDIRNNPTLYNKWVTFRADAVTNFNMEIKKAIKAANPKVLFASWGMGIRNGSLKELKEHFGLDMEKIVSDVKPDVFFIQTSSQDWSDESLDPSYYKSYDYVFNALKKANSTIKIGIQADIASHSYHNPSARKRNGVWWKNFMDAVTNHGYYTNTSYEYTFYKKQGLWIE